MVDQQLELALILKAIDQATRPLNELRKRVEGVGDEAKKNETKIQRLTKAFKELDGVSRNLIKVGAGMTALGAGLAWKTGLLSIPGEAVQLQHELRALGNVGQLTGAQLARMRAELPGISRATNQTVSSLTAGIQTLVAAGLNPMIAMQFMTTIGRAATAEQAEVTDLATTTFTVYDNLKIGINDLNKALNVMTLAGKMGRFELKDMAREFPSLSAAAKNLGLTGVPAVSKLGAALQVAMKGAGNQQEAANNFLNFMTKITSRETVANFAKLGVNLESELKRALAAGKDPIEELVLLTQMITKGDQFKLSKLFTDMQVMAFLRPMLQNIEEYRKIRQATAQADDEIGKDYTAMMNTMIEQWKRFKINISSMVMPRAYNVLELVNGAMKRINGSSLALKATLSAIAALTVGGAGLVATGMAISIIGKGLEGFARLPKLKTGLTEISTILGGKLASSFRAAAVAVRAFSIALIANPAGIAIVAAVAIGAVLIYKYWKPMTNFFKGVWSGLRQGLSPLLPLFRSVAAALSPIVAPLKAIWGWFKSLLVPVEATARSFNAGAAAGRALASVIVSVVSNTAMFVKAGANIVTSIYKGIKDNAIKPISALKEMVSKMRDLLPFSPAKAGPFRDLHKIRIVETIVSAIKPAPGIAAMKNLATQMTLQGSSHSARIAPVRGGSVTVHYAPVISFGEGSTASKQTIESMLRQHADDLLRRIEQTTARRARLAYN